MLNLMGKKIFTIEEFPIIGFYLYHVTSAGLSSNWTSSGIKQHILTVDLTLLNFYILVKILFKEIKNSNY